MTTDNKTKTSEKGFLTIPNVLSFFRLCLAPFIMYAYVFLQKYYLATAIVVLSAVTDVVDGWIARHFNMVSDIGKVLDPFADKVTQLVMFLCLITRYPLMKYVLFTFLGKELLQMTVLYVAMKKTGTVKSARWYGKASTACLYTVCIALMLIPGIPTSWSNVMIYTCIGALTLALTGYVVYSFKLIFNYD